MEQLQEMPHTSDMRLLHEHCLQQIPDIRLIIVRKSPNPTSSATSSKMRKERPRAARRKATTTATRGGLTVTGMNMEYIDRWSTSPTPTDSEQWSRRTNRERSTRIRPMSRCTLKLPSIELHPQEVR
ncbi:unnamed protein product [Larinioides sclopetarius]|uniref:Uncharacterized protein n=1 Tax=Larinioides sclopetarius TaxID=280406 RepID=A0AAV2AL35_9ARAC